MAKILVVEDDANVLGAIVYSLQQAGHTVASAMAGRSALDVVDRENPDLVLLDIMLPDGDGFSICETLRKRSSVPIVMLTAVSDEASILRGFESGADDYITKPFSPRILVARVQAVLNRAAGPLSHAGQRIELDGLTLDFGTRQITAKGKPIRLSPIESDLLFYLALHRGRLIYAEELAREVWRYQCNDKQAQAVVKTAVSRLRSKIEPNPERPRFVQTVRGKGYTFGG